MMISKIDEGDRDTAKENYEVNRRQVKMYFVEMKMVKLMEEELSENICRIISRNVSDTYVEIKRTDYV